MRLSMRKMMRMRWKRRKMNICIEEEEDKMEEEDAIEQEGDETKEYEVEKDKD